MNIPRIIIESLPVSMVMFFTPGVHDLIEPPQPWAQLTFWNYWNCYPSLWHPHCQLSKIHLVVLQDPSPANLLYPVLGCQRDVNMGTLVSLLFPYPTKDKVTWTKLLDIHLIFLALTVDVIWASVVCLLPQTILVRPLLIMTIKHTWLATALSTVNVYASYIRGPRYIRVALSVLCQNTSQINLQKFL